MAGVLPGPHLRGAGPQMQTAQQADLSSICSSRAGRSKGCQPQAEGAFTRGTPLLSYRLPFRCRLSSFRAAYPPGAFMAFPNKPSSVFAARAFCGFLTTLPIAPGRAFQAAAPPLGAASATLRLSLFLILLHLAQPGFEP